MHLKEKGPILDRVSNFRNKAIPLKRKCVPEDVSELRTLGDVECQRAPSSEDVNLGYVMVGGDVLPRGSHS